MSTSRYYPSPGFPPWAPSPGFPTPCLHIVAPKSFEIIPAQPSPAQPSQPASQPCSWRPLGGSYSYTPGRWVGKLPTHQLYSPIGGNQMGLQIADPSPNRSLNFLQRQFRQFECIATSVMLVRVRRNASFAPVRVRRNASFASASASQCQFRQFECVAAPVMPMRVRRNTSCVSASASQR